MSQVKNTPAQKNALMEALFFAQEQRPAAFETVAWAAISPFQRALMITDGMVTQLIEAYVWEKVEVTTLGQDERAIAADNTWLELPAGAPTLERQVVLRGQESAKTYVYGSSILAIERLPSAMRRDLLEGTEGIGRLLRRYQCETRRQLLWAGVERHGQMSDGVRDDFLYRSYRILAGGLPLMVIDERFPL